jgi:nitric-oxide synthase, bacterial
MSAEQVDGLLAQAEEFIDLFYAEERKGQSAAARGRFELVRRAIETTGTYEHTHAELAFAAQVAWRNSSRCIGRLYWRSLRVRDRRHMSSVTELAAEAAQHLREASNGGRIRPLITVFAPDRPNCRGPRFVSPQLVGYAGYGDGLGDPAHRDLTDLALSLGWPGVHPRSRWDVLPLVIEDGNGPVWHPLPPDAVLEVPLRHPAYRWFSQLGLRWYAVPVISDMALEAGGIIYPAAPFNGWYMDTEIGARDLGDVKRYNQLPPVAERMGLNIGDDRCLWKDRAMIELIQAVLYSFTADGVRIADHHTEAVRFLKHIQQEEGQGRRCPADWSWIVPPSASSATPVFHRYYDDFAASPRFYRSENEKPSVVARAS